MWRNQIPTFFFPPGSTRLPLWEFRSPEFNESKCTYCGKCAKVCEYHAIAVILKNVLVFDELCHGCGACSYICPERAIFEVEREIGIVQEGSANGILFANGSSETVGEPMASPLIRKAKEKVQKDKIVILDVPPEQHAQSLKL